MFLNNSRSYCKLINNADKNDKSIKYDNEYTEENIKNLIGQFKDFSLSLYSSTVSCFRSVDNSIRANKFTGKNTSSFILFITSFEFFLTAF